MKIFLVHILATKAQFQIAKDNHDLLVSTMRRVSADFEMKTSVACLTVPTFSTLAKDLEAGDEESEEEDEDDHTQQDTHYYGRAVARLVAAARPFSTGPYSDSIGGCDSRLVGI